MCLCVCMWWLSESLDEKLSRLQLHNWSTVDTYWRERSGRVSSLCVCHSQCALCQDATRPIELSQCALFPFEYQLFFFVSFSWYFLSTVWLVSQSVAHTDKTQYTIRCLSLSTQCAATATTTNSKKTNKTRIANIHIYRTQCTSNATQTVEHC